MADRDEQGWPDRLIARRIEKKGLKPRHAAALISVAWLIGIVVFGIIQHFLDSRAFETVWDGMWWATQTVTTVGYGDVVPDEGAGRLIAAVLMVGGLSLFAVITGSITSSFVARAQADAQAETVDPVLAKLAEMESELTATRAEVTRLSAALEQRPPGP